MAYLITVDDDGGVARPRATGVTVHGCVTTAGRPTRLPAWLTAMATGASRTLTRRVVAGRGRWIPSRHG